MVPTVTRFRPASSSRCAQFCASSGKASIDSLVNECPELSAICRIMEMFPASVFAFGLWFRIRSADAAARYAWKSSSTFGHSSRARVLAALNAMETARTRSAPTAARHSFANFRAPDTV